MDQKLKILLEVLDSFLILKRKSDLYYQLRGKEFYYYQEIVRHWNQLNYALKKTQRYFQKEFTKQSYTVMIYAAFRIIKEKEDPEIVLKELGLSKEHLAFLRKLKSFSWKIALKDKSEEESLSIRKAIPTIFIEKLSNVMKRDFLIQNLNYMNNFKKKSTATLRINPSLVDTAEKIKKLGIFLKKDTNLPNLYHIPSKQKDLVLSSSIYKNKKLIFQDKASATVIEVLSPNNEEFIWDLCMAPGIKTSLISNYAPRSRIIGSDLNESRLYGAKELLNVMISQKNISYLHMDSILPPFRFQTTYDKILLDAPCTGSGTFLINPELKWYQNDTFLHNSVVIQEKLLETGLKYLKDGGTLVYSTCSLYPEEGELQLIKFKNRLEPLCLPKWLSESYLIDGKSLDGMGRLFPAIHHTQGFFIGKFKKKPL